MSTTVHWFRRDLRLGDLPSLGDAAAHGDDVVGLFVVDPALWGAAGANRLRFLSDCLRRLHGETGGNLVIRSGDPRTVVPTVAAEVSADTVFISADFGPYGSRRDQEVETLLSGDGRRLVRTGSPYVVEPGTIFTKAGTPYKVFTPFSRAWRDEARRHGPHPTPELSWRPLVHDGVPDAPETTADIPRGGAAAAHEAFDAFLERVDSYDDDRNRPDLDRTSRLSPHLKWGTIHPRTLLDHLDQRKPGHRTFASELAWREFYADVLHHWPASAHENWRDDLPLQWEQPGSHFAAWTEGRTGYPIVDAGMRQLLREGWMHNRVRMIVASFLVKDLHVDWRHGARHFMEHLVDGDLASNQHGWQWTAGTGTDAQPFFRVFNPTSQGERHDPDGDYVRRYVPELRAIEGGAVHDPGERRPDSYPEPIVDHGEERRDALARYEAAKS